MVNKILFLLGKKYYIYRLHHLTYICIVAWLGIKDFRFFNRNQAGGSKSDNATIKWA